jgi:hypothetical protein
MILNNKNADHAVAVDFTVDNTTMPMTDECVLMAGG